MIFRIDVRPAHNDDRITLVEVEGDKFLYNMVRIIVGTLIDIGSERRPKDALLRALASHAANGSRHHRSAGRLVSGTRHH